MLSIEKVFCGMLDVHFIRTFEVISVSTSLIEEKLSNKNGVTFYKLQNNARKFEIYGLLKKLFNNKLTFDKKSLMLYFSYLKQHNKIFSKQNLAL